MDTIYLSFFGDGPLFDNTYLTVAYPAEYSYFRPFRYRDRWLGPGMLEEIKRVESREQLVGQSAILSMRFLTEDYKSLILPIRQAQITYIDYIPDNHSVYFTLGRMVDFRKIEKLRDGCVELPTDEITKLNGGELFFRSSVSIPADAFADNEDEDYAWSAYADKIAKDRTLPITEEARRSIFIRLSKIRSRNIVKIEEIYHSISNGKIYGPVLEEGNSYELQIFHRVPSLIGLNTSVTRLPVKYSSPTGNIELNKSEDNFGSNYQTHILIATAKKKSGTIEEVIIKPEDSSVAVDQQEPICVDKLQIQLKVKFSFWYRLRTQWWALILLTIALFLLSLIGRGGAETGAAITMNGVLSIIVSVIIVFAQSRI